MNDPGAFSLGDFPLAGAAAQTGPAVVDLAGLASLALSARLQLGSAAADAAAAALVQTSLDGGQTWFDLAAFGWSGASGPRAGGLQVAGLVPGTAAPAAPPIGALAPGGIAAGAVLGDRLRALVTVSGGGYGNATLLSLWAVAR